MTDPPPRPPDPYRDILAQNPGSRLTPDEVEFGRAMYEYQVRYRRRYPSWSEILFVLRLLGYAKVRPENGLTTETQRHGESVERLKIGDR